MSIELRGVLTLCLALGFTRAFPLRAAEFVVDPETGEKGVGLAIGRDEFSNLKIEWSGDGILMASTDLNGGWREVADQSPYVDVVADERRFYRWVPRSFGRPAVVQVPESYDSSRSIPLVLSLHGYRSNPEIVERLMPLSPYSESEGFIYCRPLGGSDRSGANYWNATEACCDFFNSGRDDVHYLERLIEVIQSQWNVDPKRIYILGHSNGGFMAYRFACERSDLVAAVVSLAGSMYLDASDCAPSSPVSVLQIHGTADVVIPFLGRNDPLRAYPGALTTVEYWASYNGCSGFEWESESTLDYTTDIVGVDTRVGSHSDCPSGVHVDLWAIIGGGHSPNPTHVTPLIPRPGAARLIVEWLFAHPKP